MRDTGGPLNKWKVQVVIFRQAKDKENRSLSKCRIKTCHFGANENKNTAALGDGGDPDRERQ